MTEKAEGEAMFGQTENMNRMGFEKQSVAIIQALRKDRQHTDGKFLAPVEKASRLVLCFKGPRVYHL